MHDCETKHLCYVTVRRREHILYKYLELGIHCSVLVISEDQQINYSTRLATARILPIKSDLNDLFGYNQTTYTRVRDTFDCSEDPKPLDTSYIFSETFLSLSSF